MQFHCVYVLQCSRNTLALLIIAERSLGVSKPNRLLEYWSRTLVCELGCLGELRCRGPFKRGLFESRIFGYKGEPNSAPARHLISVIGERERLPSWYLDRPKEVAISQAIGFANFYMIIWKLQPILEELEGEPLSVIRLTHYCAQASELGSG